MEDAKKILVEELKAAGLDIAEDAALAAAKAVLKAVPKIVAATENKFDDLVVPVLSVLEPKLFELIDKIDGKKDL